MKPKISYGTIVKNSSLTDFEELKETVIAHQKLFRNQEKKSEKKEEGDQTLHVFFEP